MTEGYVVMDLLFVIDPEVSLDDAVIPVSTNIFLLKNYFKIHKFTHNYFLYYFCYIIKHFISLLGFS